jgi:uncharacterized membrane protein
MSGNRPGRVPGKIGGAAAGGATILVLLGLAAIALGVYSWVFEEARPSSQSSDGTSWASGLGYALAIVLIAVGSVPVAAGGWILVRPRPVPLGVGAAIAGLGALFMFRWFADALGAHLDGIAIPFVLAALLLLAAILLAVALVNAPPPPTEAPRGQRGPAKGRTERWRGDRRTQKPPPGYGTRRP